MKSIFHILVSIICLAGCGRKSEAIIADFKLDDVQYTVTGAGIGYEVKNENQLDSTNGLNFMVELTLVNNTSSSIQFNKSNFRLFDDEGKEMSYSGKSGNPFAEVGDELFNLNLTPNGTLKAALLYPASKHGMYRLMVTSPVTSAKKDLSLPPS